MMLPVRNCKSILLTALLVGAVSTALADATYGDNLNYAMDNTTLVLTSPNSAAPATIYASAFLNRTDITAVIFPDNLTVINSEAFHGCTGLTEIVLPPSLTSIGVEAFKGCTSLVSVLCRPYTAPVLLSDGFANCADGLQICVPNLGSYNATSSWKNYSLTSCDFLDECDLASVTESKISTFRVAEVSSIDIYRTLRKEGTSFNTLCLPFDVAISDSPLNGAEVYSFAGATVSNGVLQLDITPVSSISAGVPYLIRWPNTTGVVLNHMQFTGIDWDSYQTAGTSGTGAVTFCGFYGKTQISDDANHSNLFLAGSNTLYWPAENDNSSMLGFRAYFQIAGGVGAPIHRGMPASLNIVSTPTGIESPSPLGEGWGEASKVLRNGQIIIIRNGEQYSITGQKL